MPHRSSRFALIPLLAGLGSASAVAAAPPLQPSLSPEADRAVDAVMPPLATLPASPRVLQDDRATTAQASAVSSAFPQVTAEFDRFWRAQAALDYAARGDGAKVRDPAAWVQMQRYLFNRYNGLSVLRSVRDGQAVFDCIPRAQQPGLRDGTVPAAPPAIAAPAGRATAAAALRCAAGTVPLRRIGMAELLQYPDLPAFLRGKAAPQNAAPAAVSDGHFHSVMYFDTPSTAVTGAGADLNAWAPKLRNTNEVQSISQLWIVGQSAQSQVQTVEVGWEVQPGAGWGDKPIVFIYSTQDGYAHTGCHNLDCADFVQTSSSNVLGVAPAGGYSVAGGKQTLLSVEFQRNTDGNWWLRVNGEWIGYYKAALYSGDLANGTVNYVSAGGETSSYDATPTPMMGSGAFAAAGYRRAAFQANHFYRDSALTTYPLQRLSSVNLQQPACYTLAIAGYAYAGGGSGVSRAALSPEMQNGGIYFGGPGCR